MRPILVIMASVLLAGCASKGTQPFYLSNVAIGVSDAGGDPTGTLGFTFQPNPYYYQLPKPSGK